MQTAHALSALPGWIVEDLAEDSVILRHESAGDPQPDDWRDRLLAARATIHNAGVVGVKRLAPSGIIHAMGDFVIHPKGYHHLGRGVPAEAYGFPEEVDGFSGGVVAVDQAIFEASCETARSFTTLGMIVLCLEAGMRGGRSIAIPDVTIVDDATPSATPEEARRFRDHFGFDWRAADLDRVRERFAGTGLLWNARLFGGGVRYTKYETRPQLHWKSYREVPVYRSRADAIVEFIVKAIGAPTSTAAMADGPRLLDLGCGDGLFTHLFAGKQCCVTGVDIETIAIEQARSAIASETYPHQPPKFMHTEPGRLPFDDGSFDAAALIDVIEHLPNPVGLLGEIARVVRPGGAIAVVTPEWQYGGWSDPVFHICEYTFDELVNQLRACGFGVDLTGRIGKPYRDLIVIARRI